MKRQLDLKGIIREMELITPSQEEPERAAWADKWAWVNVPIHHDIEKLIADDPEPMFVTVEVLNENISKNGNHYTKDVIYSVYQQILDHKPLGYLGHLKAEDASTKAPKPVTIWLGALITDDNGTDVKLWAKGYVMPSATDFRELLKKAHAVHKEMAVSIYGKGVRKRNGDHYDITEFDLESIDWVRDGQNSVPFEGLWSLTQEMVEQNPDTIPQMTLDDLKRNRPDLALQMYNDIKTDLTEQISEMVKADTDLKLQEENLKLKNEIAKLKLESKAKQAFPAPLVKTVIAESILSSQEKGIDVEQAYDEFCKSSRGQSIMRLNKPAVFAPKTAQKTEMITGRYTK